MSQIRAKIFSVFAILLLISIDLITKFQVITHLELFESKQILPLLDFTYVRNYGAGFSFLADHNGWQRYFFVILSFVIAFVLLKFLFKSNKTLTKVSYILIIAGALGNGIDRAYHGYVIDFISVYIKWFDYHFPIFNIADVCITFGVILMIVDDFILPLKEKTKQ